MPDPWYGCHDTDCDEEEEDWIIKVRHLPCMPSQSSTAVMRRCDDHFIEKLHEVAREERETDGDIIEILRVKKIVPCPAFDCETRIQERCLEHHIQTEHNEKTLTDRAYRRLKEVRAKI